MMVGGVLVGIKSVRPRCGQQRFAPAIDSPIEACAPSDDAPAV